MESKYILVNGISYNDNTNSKVIEILEICRKNKTRIVIDYGNVDSGESWNETYDIQGSVGNSSGGIKVPLLIKTNRSIGGGEIMTDCIIGIKTSIGKIPLYTWEKNK